ncbi:MAG: PAS domain S-box protein, partial [Betaproteobacteria bacterium]
MKAALYLLEAGLIAAGIVLLEGLSALAEIPIELAPRVMLSAGLSAGLVTALGLRALPGILAGTVTAGFLYYKGGIPAALVFAVAMLLQAQLIGLFAGRLGLGAYAEAPSGESGRGATSEVFDLVALAVLGACVLPTLQTVFDCASGAQPWASFSLLWWSDWIGSALGLMMLAPPVMHVLGHWRTGTGLGNALVPLSVAVLALGPAGYLLHSAAELQRELAPTAGLRLQWVQDGISWLVLCAFTGLGLLLAWLARQQQRGMQAQHAAAEALRQSEARFRSLTELSSDFYWETDADFRFTHHEARNNLAQLSGDIMGQHRWDLAGATAISSSWELHQSVLNQRQAFRDFEWMGLARDGKPYYNRVSGEPVFDALGRFTGYRGVATDISEAYRLRRAQDLSDRMTNNSPAFILALDAAGSIQAMNRAMLDAVGYREAAVLGRSYLDLFVPERERVALHATMQRMLERHKSTIDESSLLTRDGRQLTVQWHLSAVLDEQGRFEQLCAIGLDLTERKRTEQMLREAQKLEAIGQL